MTPFPALTLLTLMTLLAGVTVPGTPHQDEPPAADEVAPSQPEEETPDRGPARWRDQTYPKQREIWDRMEGQPAPALKPLTTWMNTKARTWKDLHGKVVLIHYWAVWADPAIDSLIRVKELHQRYGQDGLVVLGVHAMRGWKSMAAKVKDRRLAYPCVADPKGMLGAALGIQIVPTYYVVDRGGRMRVAGAKDKELEDMVQAMLLEPTPEYVEPEPQKFEWPPYLEKELYGKDFRGKPAPAFVVEEWLGEEPDREDKVLLIDFWATWCTPCRAAIPELNRVQKKYADRLSVIGISDEPAQTVRDFMKQERMEYAQAVDPQARMKQALEVTGVPHVLIVSRDGIVRWQGYPASAEDPLSDALVEQILRADATKLGPRKERVED